MTTSYRLGLQTILGTRSVLQLGLVQTAAESAMYIFVFLWTPILLQNSPRLPLGLVFSTFMVCIMLGSQVSAYLHQAGLSHLLVLRRSLLVMAGSLTVASLASQSASVTFFSFLLFEVAIGEEQLKSPNLTTKIVSLNSVKI